MGFYLENGIWAGPVFNGIEDVGFSKSFFGKVFFFRTPLRSSFKEFIERI
jgi:hypothetical protein